MQRTALVVPILVLVCTWVTDVPADSRRNHLDFKKNTPHITGKAPKHAAPWVHVATLGPSLAGSQPVHEALDEFIANCSRYLQEEGLSIPLGVPADANRKDLPETYVGHPEGYQAPMDAWSDEDLQPYDRHVAVMWISDPPSRWSKALAPSLAEIGAGYVLYVALEISDYAVAQRNWRGSKVVELGTGHKLSVPWLTSLDQLAEVLQFKGVLYDEQGRFVRAGAEAFHVQRTPFRLAILNVQRTMYSSELEAALQTTRDDLPGQPLAWQVALRNLVAQLAGENDALVVPEE